MLKGIGLKIGATLAFALMSAFIKAAAPSFPVSEIVFFRSIFAMAALSVWLASRGEWPSALRTSRPLGHIGRSLAGTCGMFASFIALALLPLADATAFTFVTPLLVVPLASVVLNEEVGVSRAAAVAAGFLGVLVMLSGRLGQGSADGSSGVGATVALLGAGAAAAAMIQTRRLTRSEATGAIVFYFSSLTALVSVGILAVGAIWPGAGLASGQRFVLPNGSEFAGLAAIGLLGGCGQILLTHCYRFADASILVAFDYLSMIWAAGLGFLLFAETPAPSVLVGGAIVIAAGVGVSGASMWPFRRQGIEQAPRDASRATCRPRRREPGALSTEPGPAPLPAGAASRRPAAPARSMRR
jgi:drug/metabolite transporter (DMT)-like permease